MAEANTAVQFDFISLVIGLLLGMIVMLLLVWIAYFSRSFIFSYCPTSGVPCSGKDYYNDPGNALGNNPQLTASDILFLNSNNEMFYNRVPKTSNCTPESNQVVQIVYPQYCSFKNSSGSTGTWRETFFNSNVYLSSAGVTLTTIGNCDPAPGSPVVSGIPLVQWDASPVSF